MMEWQQILEQSFCELDAFLRESNWLGRENEVVNLFAHRFLADKVSKDGPFQSLRQVGIEVAVPQVTDSSKEFVRKDIVIWPAPDMTAWPSERIPSAIVEWKRGTKGACKGDIAWLETFCCKYPQTLGYAVCVRIECNRGCEFTRVDGKSRLS